MNPKLRLRLLFTAICLIIILLSTTTKLTVSWIESQDSADGMSYYKTTFGMFGGIVGILSEDYYGDNEAMEFTLEFHPPAIAPPFVSTGWWDVWVIGIAAWLLSLLMMISAWLTHRVRMVRRQKCDT